MPRPSARRALLVRGLLALGVLAASAFTLLTVQPRLGLDLRGGTQIVLETPSEATSDATDRAMEVLRRRVDELGVAEPVLARSGDHRIVVELPGVQDPTEAIEVLGRTAQLRPSRLRGDALREASDWLYGYRRLWSDSFDRMDERLRSDPGD